MSIGALSVSRDTSGAVVIGPQGLPPLTLGWQVLAWTIDYLLQPDGPAAGLPFRFTPEQVRIVLWWYAINPADPLGRFIYRRGVIRRSKGWGKDPFTAALSIVELLGPCRLSHFDGAGQPVAAPHATPWIQLAAVTQSQTRNTMSLIAPMLAPAAISRYGLDLGKEIIYSAAGGQIQAVTSSPRALEGGRPTLVVPNETQWWLVNNNGVAMSEVLKRNAAKSRDGAARNLAVTNAHEPGMGSVGEQDYEAFRKILEGRTRARGLYYDSREAPPDTDLGDPESLRRGLIAAYGDSTWIDIDRVMEEIYDPATLPSQARRFFLNQITAAEDAWTTGPEWDSCETGDRIQPGDKVVIGFDGSRSDDATAICLVRFSDGLLDLAAWWERPDGPPGDGWEVDRPGVDQMLDYLCATYDVAAIYADVREWESYIDSWDERFRDRLKLKASRKSACGWDMRARVEEFTRRGAETLNGAIRDKTLKHTGHPVLRRHVLNARRRPNRWGVSFGKEHRESPRKVDALAAAVLARLARADLIAGPTATSKTRTGRVWAA